MAEVLEHNNEVLLQMQAAKHTHEKNIMSFLAQMITPKSQPFQNVPPPLFSNNQSFPPGPQHYQHFKPNQGPSQPNLIHFNSQIWSREGPQMCPQEHQSFLRDPLSLQLMVTDNFMLSDP